LPVFYWSQAVDEPLARFGIDESMIEKSFSAYKEYYKDILNGVVVNHDEDKFRRSRNSQDVLRASFSM
jgi:hypothetical protein